jgi:protoheme IX farnesyltransferase
LIETLSYYSQLIKFRLSSSVVFSAIAGYLLGLDQFYFTEFLLLAFGGFFVTGSANGFNQVLEREHDKHMNRTANRPLPKKNLSVSQALIFSIITGLLGLYLLNFIKPEGSYFGWFSKSGLFGLISILLYALIYTPLKRLSSMSVFVGAFPGAIPFLLGWVAASDYIGIIGGILFSIQFFWQFPHFIAISWVLDEEYSKAGFKMMFGRKKSHYPVIISICTSLIMTFLSVVPYFWEQSQLSLSLPSAILMFILGLWFTWKSIKLYRSVSDESAKELMISSFIYLPLMQIIFIADKFLKLL